MAIGMPELVVIFLVVLLLFGSKRLPELARGLGEGIREFKRATNEFKNELNVQQTRKEFEKEVRGSLDEINRDLNKPVSSEGVEVDDKATAPKK